MIASLHLGQVPSRRAARVAKALTAPSSAWAARRPASAAFFAAVTSARFFSSWSTDRSSETADNPLSSRSTTAPVKVAPRRLA
ncbi:MAG: hypothetical protein ACYDH5_18465 [Acidimicrobiales bacterium]